MSTPFPITYPKHFVDTLRLLAGYFQHHQNLWSPFAYEISTLDCFKLDRSWTTFCILIPFELILCVCMCLIYVYTYFFYGKENFQKLFLNVGINIYAWQQFNCFVLNLRLTGNTASCFCVLPLCRYIAFTWALQRCYLALISSVQTYTT